MIKYKFKFIYLNFLFYMVRKARYLRLLNMFFFCHDKNLYYKEANPYKNYEMEYS